ncbi:hypothetical protein COV82_04970 [Candidatus Peregrinibacteria bacterium CG11_big_fil_rev_8_21_14_0_20_46_8]|nr:MAG: hypothetical protein COV82_04970 [Candidatus Peregrinibacteria bacterium CG11_big_fil_rev_8_21_14_0_20_46_8]
MEACISHYRGIDGAYGESVDAAIGKAESKMGRSFNNGRVLSVSEMGDAAGRCHMGSSRPLEYREDIFGLNPEKLRALKDSVKNSAANDEAGLDSAEPPALSVEQQSILTHVLVHEAVHDGQDCDGTGCDFEGATERKASRISGHAPVAAYADKVRAANDMASEIGESTFEKIVSGPNAKINAMREYVAARVKKNGVEDFERASAEAEALMQRAA